jgi:hypothetical protein
VDYALLRSGDELSRAEDGAAVSGAKKEAPRDQPWGATKEAATGQPVARRLRLEVLARNSTTKFESRASIPRFTTNIQNLTFQSPLKLAVKPIVSLVRPTNSLFVSCPRGC